LILPLHRSCSTQATPTHDSPLFLGCPPICSRRLISLYSDQNPPKKLAYCIDTYIQMYVGSSQSIESWPAVDLYLGFHQEQYPAHKSAFYQKGFEFESPTFIVRLFVKLSSRFEAIVYCKLPIAPHVTDSKNMQIWMFLRIPNCWKSTLHRKGFCSMSSQPQDMGPLQNRTLLLWYQRTFESGALFYPSLPSQTRSHGDSIRQLSVNWTGNWL